MLTMEVTHIYKKIQRMVANKKRTMTSKNYSTHDVPENKTRAGVGLTKSDIQILSSKLFNHGGSRDVIV